MARRRSCLRSMALVVPSPSPRDRAHDRFRARSRPCRRRCPRRPDIRSHLRAVGRPGGPGRPAAGRQRLDRGRPGPHPSLRRGHGGPTVDPPGCRAGGIRAVRHHDCAWVPHAQPAAPDGRHRIPGRRRADGRELRVEPRAFPGAPAVGLARARPLSPARLRAAARRRRVCSRPTSARRKCGVWKAKRRSVRSKA